MHWNDYFIGIAKAVSEKSKDPMTKVGAVLVDRDMRIVSTGYNGFPPGVPEPEHLWQRPEKYSRVVHAEMNAIGQARRDLRGCIIYSTLQPCPDCLKMIAAVGIDRIIYQNSLREPYDSIKLAEFFGISMTQM